MYPQGAEATWPRENQATHSPADQCIVCVASHGTSNFESWLQDVYLAQPAPPGMTGCFRGIACRGLAEGEAITISFFPPAELSRVRSYYDVALNPLWVEGDRAGWMSGPLHINMFVPSLYRGVVAGPPGPIERGAGLLFGAHGLTIGYEMWASYFTSANSDVEHEKLGVTASIAGRLLPGGSDAVPPGPGVLHLHESPDKALELLRNFEPSSAAIKRAIDMGVIRTPVYGVAGEVRCDSSGYGRAPRYRGSLALTDSSVDFRSVVD